MIQSVAGLKMMIQLVAGLIQRTGNVKMTRMQSLPPRSSQSGGGAQTWELRVRVY